MATVASVAGTAECAICFDELLDADRISLPCQCRVEYCLRCWDRALACSFNDSGRAQCPTCRSPVRVDFDAAAAGGRGRLVFSSERDSFASSSRSRSEVVNRLAEQAAPIMTRNLREYGANHPTLRPSARNPESLLRSRPVRELKALLRTMAGGAADETSVEKADIIERIRECAIDDVELLAVVLPLVCVAADETDAAATADASAQAPMEPAPTPVAANATTTAIAEGGSSSAAGGGAAPVLRCVCGGRLARLGGRARLRPLFAKEYPQLDAAQLEQVRLHSPRMRIGRLRCDP